MMLRKRLQQFDPIMGMTLVLVLVAMAAVLLTLFASSAGAAGGGVGTGSGVVTNGPKAKPHKARLLANGKAIPPKNAPRRVVKAIDAANKIRKKPYVWGGGHGKWNDRGYDCSGAVSYALHGGHMLNVPMDSGTLARSWGKRGKGDWITVYANGGHAYTVIAGLRFDTSQTGGNGPRWSKQMVSSRGFTAKHYKGL